MKTNHLINNLYTLALGGLSVLCLFMACEAAISYKPSPKPKPIEKQFSLEDLSHPEEGASEHEVKMMLSKKEKVEGQQNYNTRRKY